MFDAFFGENRSGTPVACLTKSKAHAISGNAKQLPVTISALTFTSHENPDKMSAKTTADEAFQQFADAMPLMMWMCAADGSVTFFNKTWCEYTELSMKDSLGDGWERAVHPDDRPRAMAAWQEAIQTRHKYEIELRYRMVNGSYRWHLAKSIPTLNADGTVHHWQGICTDIDSQHDSLVSAEAMTRAIVDNVDNIKDNFDSRCVQGLDHRAELKLLIAGTGIRRVGVMR